MPVAWLPWKYAIAFVVVYFSFRQVASWGVAVGLGLASFPILWWIARRVSDRRADAESRQLPKEGGLRSRVGEIASSLNPVGHQPLPPLRDTPGDESQER